MFKEELFVYDPQTHTATYDGNPIPSVTQLVDLLFPYDENIPQERLEKAAERGTKVHSDIELLNELFDGPFFDTNLERAIKEANSKETIDYLSLISAYKLRPFDYENVVFLFDENGELICYGHYDLTCMALEDNVFAQDRLYMFDVKTTSLFDKRKVSFQMSIYALAYEQCSKQQIEGIYGIWLNESGKIIPLERKDNTYVINLCKGLVKIWNDRRNLNEN